MESNNIDNYSLNFSKPHLDIHEINGMDFLISSSNSDGNSDNESSYSCISSSDEEVNTKNDWIEAEKVYFMGIEGEEISKYNPSFYTKNRKYYLT